ncbi:MAG: class I SAM-dependent RNA methyltransferase [Pseudomonadota bacterium]
MPDQQIFDIRLVTAPGLEKPLAEEACAHGFAPTGTDPGGVELRGTWPDIWRANLRLRGASRVLVRLASFRAMHPAQLDKRARKVPWGQTFRPDTPVRIDVTCRKSKIYHAGAARDRIARAITEELGAPVTQDAAADPLRLVVRIEDDLCTISLDTSGAPLHQRGHKQAVGKAPLRETMAAMFLRQAGFDGSQTVVDPMCGSGTIPIEAAEIARGLAPGRSRAFAFQRLSSFDPQAWEAMRSAPPQGNPIMCHGSDRDAGAVAMATENATRADVIDNISFARQAISDVAPPPGPPGIVVTNPPYGGRIGNRKLLFGLYGSLGETLRARFSGWRVGIVTNDAGLAKATGLRLKPAGPPVAHGGLKVILHLATIP